jgi:glyoxylase I family protein
MSIEPKTPGIHHVALRCTDFNRAKDFYNKILGFPIVADLPDLIGFMAGPVLIAFKQASPKYHEDKTFNPFNIGLDHVALICEDETELRRVAQALSDNGIENTGVKLDNVLQKLYVAFKDPDRIQWEFYMR